MSYVVLARKYRPRTFDDLVGQESVSRTLKNAIDSGRIAHAYIFSGPRGVGKTTTARILANCLNNPSGPSSQPDLESDLSRSISEGTSVDDVLEIDGASNRGIEQIRDLRDSAKYTPAKSRYRIYIIDEAHQITKDAFGALLKTLEEPPAHVVFMMATTEVHKIPAPILSRCQRFSLRPITPDLVFDHLKKICGKEKIKIEDDALRNIVRFVEGSLRDALSLLDQALVYAPDGITSATLRELLGLLPAETVHQAARIIKNGDPAEILRFLTQTVKNGVDLTQLAKDLQSYYHSLLLAKAGVDDPLLPSMEEFEKSAKTYTFEELERSIRILARAQEEMRRSDSPRAVFEVHALRLGQKVLDARSLVEQLNELKKTGGNGRATVQQFPPRAAPRPKPAPPPSRSEQTRASIGFAGPSVAAASPSSVTVAPPVLSETEMEAKWPVFLASLEKQQEFLASVLEEADAAFSGSAITLTFQKAFSENRVKRSLPILKSCLESHFGRDFEIQTNTLPLKKTSVPATTSAVPPASSPAKDESLMEDVPPGEWGDEIKKAVEYFPGRVRRPVKPS